MIWMRSLVLALLTAAWMWRKRQFSSARRRLRRVLARARPLKILRTRAAESRLQTISGGPVWRYFGTEPFDGSGNSVERSGCASALLAQSANVPSSTTSVQTLLIRTATYTIRRQAH